MWARSAGLRDFLGFDRRWMRSGPTTPGSSAVWQRTCFGSRRPGVQIPPPRPSAVDPNWWTALWSCEKKLVHSRSRCPPTTHDSVDKVGHFRPNRLRTMASRPRWPVDHGRSRTSVTMPDSTTDGLPTTPRIRLVSSKVARRPGRPREYSPRQRLRARPASGGRRHDGPHGIVWRNAAKDRSATGVEPDAGNGVACGRALRCHGRLR